MADEQAVVSKATERRRAALVRAREARRRKAEVKRETREAPKIEIKENVDYTYKPNQLALLKEVKDGFRRRWIRCAGHQAELNVQQKQYRGYEIITKDSNDPIGPQRRGDLILARIPEQLAQTYERNVVRRSRAAVNAAEQAAHAQLRRQGLRTFEADTEGREREPDLGNRLDRIRAAEKAGIDPDTIKSI